MLRDLITRHCVCLLLAFFASNAWPSQPLKPFEVVYELNASGIHAADVTVSLDQKDGQWQWRTEVEAASWVALFSDKQSFTQTRLTVEAELPRLTLIEIGENSETPLVESASFDWSRKQLTSVRKGLNRTLTLDGPVYDAQSIHLLAARIYFSAGSETQATYYHKGELHKATMSYEGLQKIEIEGKLQRLELFTLKRDGSDTLINYFYPPGEMLYPLRIERKEPDESAVIMNLRANPS